MKEAKDHCRNYTPFNLKKQQTIVLNQIQQIEREEFKKWQGEKNPKEKTIGLRSIFYNN